jgi:hypothetical protein
LQQRAARPTATTPGWLSKKIGRQLEGAQLH